MIKVDSSAAFYAGQAIIIVKIKMQRVKIPQRDNASLSHPGSLPYK